MTKNKDPYQKIIDEYLKEEEKLFKELYELMKEAEKHEAHNKH